MREALAIAAVLVASDAAAEAPAARRLDWPGKTPPPAASQTPAPTTPPAAEPATPRPEGARTELAKDFFVDGDPVDLADPPPQPLSERDERRLRAEATSPDTLSN